jgi:predicted ATPase/DNA-binding SARP family transcriptional activator
MLGRRRATRVEELALRPANMVAEEERGFLQMDVRWRIEMLGGLRAVQGHQVLTRFRTQKTGSLLAYLAYYPQRSHLRDALIELFWPDGDPSAGRNNLSRELSWLRQHLEPPSLPPGTVIAAERAAIGLIPEAVATDVAAFEAALRAAEHAGSPAERARHLAEAIEGYGGELLPGHYEGWVLQEREWLADRYFEALGQLLAHLEQTGEISQALEYARQGVRVDLLREEAHRDLIRLLAAAGQPGAALRQYRELERLLKQELETGPSAATLALIQQLMPQVDEEPADRSVTVAAPPGHEASPGKLHAHLPMPRSPLLGRAREVAAIRQLLRSPQVGLVTLTGTAGTGKTRLALQVAAELRDEFQDGVYWVDLAPLRDSVLVGSAIAQVLGVRETGGTSLVQSLKQSLREKECLLLLDNFEQVIEAGSLLAELLAAAPVLKLLVISRIVLCLRDEHEYPVAPLALPDPSCLPSFPELSRYAAVELFVQRARAARPEFALTEENAAAVAEICVRLDGLPLAIELAAARIRLLPPQALLSRLGNRLGLLTGGARDLPARQQTLRDAIAWSYDLLVPEEQRLFRRLSVVVGGCTLEAVAAVHDAEGDPQRDVLNRVASLVDQNLLQQEVGAEGEPRFMMLETIREFGRERLAESGEEDAVRRQHAEFFLELVEARPGWERLEAEHDNSRAAMTWSLAEAGDPGMALRLAVGLAPFWDLRGYLSEGRGWLKRALAVTPDEATPLRAKALYGAGLFAVHCGRPEEGRCFLEESVAANRALGDRPDLLQALGWLSNAHHDLGDLAAARACRDEGLALARQGGDKAEIAGQLGGQGLLANGHGDYRAARGFFEECRTIWEELGERWNADWARSNWAGSMTRLGEFETARPILEEFLAATRAAGYRGWSIYPLAALGRNLLGSGDLARARALFEEALEISRETGQVHRTIDYLADLAAIARCERAFETARSLYEESLVVWREQGRTERPFHMLVGLGDLSWESGDLAAAHAFYQEALTLRRRTPHKECLAECLEGLAGVAAGQGREERAARLLGAAEALRDAGGAVILPHRRPAFERLLADVRTALGEEAFAAAWAAGRALSLEEAIALALEESADA